jgi:hypothetical protein
MGSPAAVTGPAVAWQTAQWAPPQALAGRVAARAWQCLAAGLAPHLGWGGACQVVEGAAAVGGAVAGGCRGLWEGGQALTCAGDLATRP